MESLVRKVKIENEHMEDIQPIDNPSSILDILYSNAEDVFCFRKYENLWNASSGILISECISFVYRSEHYIYIKIRNCTPKKIEAFCIRMFQDEGPLYENYTFKEAPKPLPGYCYYYSRSGTELDLCFKPDDSQKNNIVGWKVATRSNRFPLTFIDCAYHAAGAGKPYYHAVCNFVAVKNEEDLDSLIYERTKKLITTDRSGTSKAEATIFYNVRRLFPDTINRAAIQTGTKTYEADVFIPSLRIAIEYDGKPWHQDKKDFDEEKNQALNAAGIYVIRVRDVGLPELNPFNGVVYYHGKAPKGMHTNEYITCIVHEIAKNVKDDEMRRNLLAFEITYPDILKQDAAISGILLKEQKKNDITALPWFSCWDYEKNIGLDPKTINDTTKSSAWFICHEKKSILVSTLQLYDLKKCIKDNNIPEEYSASAICPFAESCECASGCEYYKQECKELFFRLLDNQEYKPDLKTIAMMKKADHSGMYFIKYVLSLEDVKQKEVCEHFLVFDRGRPALRVELSSADELAFLERFIKIYPKANLILNWQMFDQNEDDREKLLLFYAATLPFSTWVLQGFFTDTLGNPLLPSEELCNGLKLILTQEKNIMARMLQPQINLLMSRRENARIS